MAKVHERGKEPVDEDHAVLRTGADRTLPRPGRKPGPVPLVPQQPYLSDEFRYHRRRQARDPPVADNRCARRVPTTQP
ncbi:hypothetical protein [Streptomyces sp. SID2119]|uniref:hypothetical protein n=1 Tax=Streptomyces sp. SID2119 TaxID=2690253 RepID=UPI00136E5A7F|nr:hypothetical protein [Streptomyces sp. SID2119]MYW31111.1 hypothetical protein [Streptomyces sp. SID2119]